MSRFRTLRLRRGAAWLAILGLFFQASLAAWHATAMFAALAGPGDAHAAIVCHAEAAGERDVSGADTDRSQPPRIPYSCSCCLGVVSAAVDAGDAAKLSYVALTADRFFPVPAGEISSGRHPLAPESRGPPRV